MARGWESKSIESQQADAARPVTKGRAQRRLSGASCCSREREWSPI
jgi:hypothetical protein